MTQPSPLGSPGPWELVAAPYVDDVMPMLEAFSLDALRLVSPPNGARIVDVACGPGTLSMIAAREGLVVDAIDFSPSMIARLEARIHGLAVTPHVGDGQALPYADGTFTAGFSMFGLMFFPDRAKGFAELARVLAPGGRAVVSSWIPLEENVPMRAMFAAVMAAWGQPPAMPPTPLGTPDACRAEMGGSFRDVEVHRVAHAQVAESIDAMWASIARSMAPIVLLRKAMGEEKWKRADEGARAALDKELGGKPELEMTALLSVGTKP